MNTLGVGRWRGNHMLKRMIYLLLALLLLNGCATTGKPWERAENKRAGKRYIPIELWTGEAWTGEREMAMNPAHFIFGKRRHKSIKGPVQWRHPITGQDLTVYERINKTTKGIKRQLFTVNPDSTGLAKVYDNRPNMMERFQTDNAVLFPLGLWRKGERREYEFYEFVNGKKAYRKATIRMRRLSFTYKEVKHAMKYDWILTDEKGQILFHERFIYAPGKSLMYYKDRLKRHAAALH